MACARSRAHLWLRIIDHTNAAEAAHQARRQAAIEAAEATDDLIGNERFEDEGNDPMPQDEPLDARPTPAQLARINAAML